MKLYRTRTQAEYDWLMQKLEDEGYMWMQTQVIPTAYNFFKDYKSETVIRSNNFGDLLCGTTEYYEETHPDQPIIEVADLMDTKFKVGDEVRIVENAGGTITDRRGEVHTVVRVSPKDLYPYELSNTLLYSEDCLEPITDHDYLMDKILERNNKPEKLNTGDPWIDNLPESYFEMYEEESKTDKYARHKEITDFMYKTYVSKNKDYGNSFERTHKEIGSRASLGRIADKFYRLQNIILNDEQLVEDETVIDTLIDMANYAIMFAMELEETE